MVHIKFFAIFVEEQHVCWCSTIVYTLGEGVEGGARPVLPYAEDKAIIEACEKSVEGKGDGRVSMEDAQEAGWVTWKRSHSPSG